MDAIDFALYLAYFLVIGAALGAIVLPFIGSIANPKSLLKSGLGVVALGLIYLIGYLISDNEVTAGYLNFGVGATASKLIGGALITMYLLLGIAAISIIYTEISKIIK
jgi:hypothetical protein